ncbi:MAG: hypothetical protein AABY68_00200 [Pseudomonadota bacterium]
MIKGLAITPPVLGRITIGRVIEKDGKRLPEKDDQFTITSQIQTRDGWLVHPLDEELRARADSKKLRAIPVRMLFNDADLNLRAEYSLFDRNTGRPVCVGNGETCRRSTVTGIEQLPCPSPSACELGKKGGCKPYGRLNVRIGDDDELGTFIFRTTGYNSIRSLIARLRYFQALSGNLLSCLPLEMRLRGKSTTQSHRTPIYYADLTVREGMSIEGAMQEAKATHAKRLEAGLDQEALDEAARVGFENSAFEDDEEEETPAILEEFYPAEDGGSQAEAISANRPPVRLGLKEKLAQRSEAAGQQVA